MTDTSDNLIDVLVEHAKAGDRTAFGKLVALMMNRTVALTYRMTGDMDAAEDLAQDTFVSAWQNLGGFKGAAKFESWIYRIASNKSLNYLKRAGRSTDIETVMEAQSDDNPERAFSQKELRRDMLEFMGSLPPQQRLVFELHFYQERTFEEIASMTDKAHGTVKTLYREAVKKLREAARVKGWRS
ncbi:MAG TPA: RNA polymerase sigma factor [candidate division Zixibacteria bacterium]|nr:RNA polymerase sigma factor [candidate division Zixibacteria bacterium]